MTKSRLGWMLAAAIALVSGDVAAAPADCLSYRDNPHVTSCANPFGQSTPSRPRTAGAAAQTLPRRDEIRVIANSDLISVPVVVAVKAAPAPPAPPPEAPMFTVDRQILTNTVVIGALAGSLLVAVVLGAWRFGSTLRRDCPWCASKISRSAHTCPRCFRAL